MAQGNWGPGFAGGIRGAKGRSVMEGMHVRAGTLSPYSPSSGEGQGVPDCPRVEENHVCCVGPPSVVSCLPRTLTQRGLTQQKTGFLLSRNRSAGTDFRSGLIQVFKQWHQDPLSLHPSLLPSVMLSSFSGSMQRHPGALGPRLLFLAFPAK